MKRTTLLLIGVIISLQSIAQDYQSQFNNYFQQGEKEKLWEVLEAWNAADSTNPELFTSYFNYYYIQAMKEQVVLTTEELEGDVLILEDSLGQTAGYMGSERYYDSDELAKGFQKINEGIALYPNRLDMRFGKIHVMGLLEDWDGFTRNIIEAIHFSAINGNHWTWMNNEVLEDGKDFFLLSIQDYQIQLYNTGDDDLLINMRDIANEVLNYYPEHIESLSNLSITYLLTGEYDQGIEVLLRAEAIAPEDYIVLGNIAQGYKLKGDSTKAVEYYKKVIRYGDEESKAYAEGQLKVLGE